MSTNMAQIRTLIDEIFQYLDNAELLDDQTAYAPARRRFTKLKLLIATAPVEMQNELTRMKWNNADSIQGLLDDIESLIAQGENGGGFGMQRIELCLPHDTAHQTPVYEEEEET